MQNEKLSIKKLDICFLHGKKKHRLLKRVNKTLTSFHPDPFSHSDCCILIVVPHKTKPNTETYWRGGKHYTHRRTKILYIGTQKKFRDLLEGVSTTRIEGQSRDPEEEEEEGEVKDEEGRSSRHNWSRSVSCVRDT